MTKEWLKEPNFLEFQDEKTRLNCTILRNARSGHLCGYVQIPKRSPLFGLQYWHPFYRDIYVHGGLTFSDCHYLSNNNDVGSFYVGFDCAHDCDVKPFNEYDIEMAKTNNNKTYKNIDYVKYELSKLCELICGRCDFLTGMRDKLTDEEWEFIVTGYQ